MHVTIGKQVGGECCQLQGALSKWMSTGRGQLGFKHPVLQSKVCMESYCMLYDFAGQSD